MPTVLRLLGFKFFFYSNEGDPLEPPHVHVRKGGCEAKVWLEPTASVEWNEGFKRQELRRIIDLVNRHKGKLEAAWHDHFTQT